MFELNQPYQADYKLFDELKLNHFNAKYGELTYIGKVTNIGEYDDVDVELWVTCLPAQFYIAKISIRGQKPIFLKTGSGTLSDFWPTFKLIANGMIVIDTKLE